MTYILMFLTMLSIYFLLVSYMNKYSWYFGLIIWSLIGAMYSVFLLISASGNYSSIGYIFGDLDKRIFLSIIKNKINLSSMIRLFNITSALYLFSLSLFTLSYFYDKDKNPIRYIFGQLALLLVFPILYCVFYDPAVVYAIYCRIVSRGNSIFFAFICAVDILFYIASCIYLTFPLFYLWRKRKKPYTYYKKKQLTGIGIFVILTDIIYILTLRLSSLKKLYIGNDPYSLIAIRTYGAMFNHEYIIYPAIMFAAIILIFYIVGKFYLIRKYGIINRIVLRYQAKHINENLLNIFHSVKNVVFSHKVLLVEAQNASGEHRELLLDNLSKQMDKYIEHLSLMLSSNEVDADFAPEKCYVSDVIERALAQFTPPDRIEINKDYSMKAEEIYADLYYMSEVFLNVLQNASDAITKKASSGTITIEVKREFDLVAVIFTDDGVGMENKEIKNIFKPFYTTKSRICNWGVGLSFVYRIVKLHKGNILIKSEKGIGTSLCIILPVA